MAIMESLDAIKGKAVDAASAAAKKTRKLAEIARANLAIVALEDKIRKAQLELGKLYYRDYAVEEEHDEAEYLTWCKKIDEAHLSIADLRDYIEDLKDEDAANDVESSVEAE